MACGEATVGRKLIDPGRQVEGSGVSWNGRFYGSETVPYVPGRSLTRRGVAPDRKFAGIRHSI